jgi:mutator protein MutT
MNMQVVGAIIKNHEDEYLLQLRDDKAPTFKNKWTLFGGKVEDGELPEQALTRELEEELSVPDTAIESLRQVQINDQENGEIKVLSSSTCGCRSKSLETNLL